MKEVLQMDLVALKVEVLKNILNQEIKMNDFSFNHRILVLSQILDEFIVEHQKQILLNSEENKKVVGGTC
jgi:hypothetical protein